MDKKQDSSLSRPACYSTTSKKNKRAQRALGRSPEEKVKGHSEANKREPQGHNLNNFDRGPLDDAIYQIWKLWALLFQTRRFLKIAFWKPTFWPRDLLMQPIRTIFTILVGDHQGTIPVEFGQIPISGSREDVVRCFPHINQCKIVTPGAGSILTPGA